MPDPVFTVNRNRPLGVISTQHGAVWSPANGGAGGCPAGWAADCDAVSLLPLGVMEPSLGVGGDSCWVSALAGAHVVGALRSQQLALFFARAAPHSVDLVCCQRVP